MGLHEEFIYFYNLEIAIFVKTSVKPTLVSAFAFVNIRKQSIYYIAVDVFANFHCLLHWMHLPED